MSWIRRVRRNALRAIALGFAVSTVAAAPATSAVVRHDLGSASQGSASAIVGVSDPDGYQPQTKGMDVALASAGTSVDWGNVALGLGLGLGIAALCALMVMDRGHLRVAHS